MTWRARVLVVDDEAGIRESIQHLLFDEEWVELLLAEDGPSALKTLEEEEVDVIVSDYNMPGMNGLQLMERARRMHPDMIRILLSGRVDLQEVAAAFNNGLIARFIVKPWGDDQELIATLRTAIRNRQSLVESRRLVDQYETLKAQVDRLGQAVLANYLALRHDRLLAQDGEFLRRQLNMGGPDGIDDLD